MAVLDRIVFETFNQMDITQDIKLLTTVLDTPKDEPKPSFLKKAFYMIKPFGRGAAVGAAFGACYSFFNGSPEMAKAVTICGTYGMVLDVFQYGVRAYLLGLGVDRNNL